MMEIKELRIGNFVNTSKTKNLLEVFAISFDYIYLSDLNEDYESILEDLTPIPLTEEWLIKFGFEKAYETCYQYKDFILNDKFIMMDIDITIQLKHVHQLQNLYFALTGEEL